MLRSGAWFAKPALTLRSAKRVSKGEGGLLTMRALRLQP
jgi:hypothetical protein